MPPGTSTADRTYRRLANREALGQDALCFCRRTNGSHVGLREVRTAVILSERKLAVMGFVPSGTALKSLRKPPDTTALTCAIATLSGTIPGIVQHGSEKQVVGINAPAHIAVVQYACAVVTVTDRDCTVVQFPAKPVRSNVGVIFGAEVSISRAKQSASPKPAIVWAAPINILPKALSHGWQFSSEIAPSRAKVALAQATLEPVHIDTAYGTLYSHDAHRGNPFGGSGPGRVAASRGLLLRVSRGHPSTIGGGTVAAEN